MSTQVKKDKMKGRDKTEAVMKKASSSSDDSDLDMETNFALLSKKGLQGGGQEREDYSDDQDEDEEEEGSDDGDEGEEGSDKGEEVSDDGDEGEEGSDDAHEGEEGSDDAHEEEEVSDDGDEGEEGSDDAHEEEEVSDDGDSDEGEVEGDEEEDSKSSEEEEDEDAQSEGVDDGGKIQNEDDIKKELSTMSFEDILKLQKQVGTKVYNEIAYGTSKAPQANSKRKRLNKNRPMEISAKRHVPFLRQVVPVKKTILRDPRFDDLSGEYKPEIFDKTYKFINDIRQREKEIVKKQLKKTKGNEKKERFQFLLKRMENQERARKTREEQREKELEFKRKQREMAGQGLKPFFLKNSDKKKLQLADKYNQLKKSGKLENFLSKKRKRNATKDRRRLPHKAQ
ncbi:ribosomal RNA processing protein 36 homolog [Polymixia lowei]